MTDTPPEACARTYAWTPYDGGSHPTDGRSGLGYFQGLANGSIAEQPITSTIGWTIDAVAAGMLRLRFAASSWLFHGGGLVHGGVVATLLDSAASGAVLSACQPGQRSTTTQLSINFVRGIRPGEGPFVAEGRVISMGRTVAIGIATIKDAGGRLYAQATATCLILWDDEAVKTERSSEEKENG